MNIDQRCFGSGQDEPHSLVYLAGFQPEHILGKLGELSGGKPALVIKDVGRQYELVTILDMLLDKIVQKRPFK